MKTTAPDLVALRGVGVDVAGALLVAAGDNPERLAREASFAALCGVSPVDASSGKQHRHRLNRGGNRDANRALWVIALVRCGATSDTRVLARRTKEGLSKPEILRCLKRYIAREVFKIIQDLLVPGCRERRSQNPLIQYRSINAVAENFFATLKHELEEIDDLESRAQATLLLGEYIDGFYNVQRRHSAIDYRSPIEFELVQSVKEAA